MERFVMEKLQTWKDSNRRKPLIIQGARQVGKTWVMKEFGSKNFGKTVYLNFERRPELKEFFQRSKDPSRIISLLSVEYGPISPDDLIVLDEIQECPEALNSLKYFQEEAPQYHIIAAGSLLGLKLSDGFPVGKVNFIPMFPLSFYEFLHANGDDKLLEYLRGLNEISPIPELFHNTLCERLKTYFLLGGMPEVVDEYIKNKDIAEAEDILDEILLSYQNDFGKHSDKIDVNKIRLVYDSLPSQLAKENKKFLYKTIKEGARARDYEAALNWLKEAEIIKKSYRVEKPGLPLSAYEDVSCFKIYANDVGLLRRKSRLVSSAIKEGNRLFGEFKGALSENYVLLSLLSQSGTTPPYWADDVYEVDFLVEHEKGIIPVEVKSGENVKATSLKNYLKHHQESPLGVRLSLLNLSFDGRVLNIPLYLCDSLSELVDVALSS